MNKREAQFQKSLVTAWLRKVERGRAVMIALEEWELSSISADKNLDRRESSSNDPGSGCTSQATLHEIQSCTSCKSAPSRFGIIACVTQFFCDTLYFRMASG